jgi:hypothetical protein
VASARCGPQREEISFRRMKPRHFIDTQDFAKAGLLHGQARV